MSLADVYQKKDAERLNGSGFTKDDYINAGPGKYVVELVGFKLKKSQKDKTFNQDQFIFELEVVSADPLTRGNETYRPEYKPGDKVTYMKTLTNRANTKEAWNMLGALLGLPPVVIVPAGPDKDAVLPILDDETKKECAANEAADFIGTRCAIDMVPNEGKGDYAGKTFYNAYPKPVDEDGMTPAPFPEFSEVVERVGAEAFNELYQARFGAEYKAEYAGV